MGVGQPGVDRGQPDLGAEADQDEGEGHLQPEGVDLPRPAGEVGEVTGTRCVRLPIERRMMPTKARAMPTEQMKTYFQAASSEDFFLSK